MKTVIITGASRGIGAQTARLFAKNGYATIINYNNSHDEAMALRDELISQGYCADIFKADVSAYDECQAMVQYVIKKYKRIDVLVNNAGMAQIKPLFDVTEQDFDKMMAVNFKSVFNTCKLVSDYMVSQKSGKIINVSSVWGEVGSSCETVYCASKAAVIGFTKALAKELGPSNINVNCVAPGFIQTDMNSCLSQQDVDDIVNETPLSRVGTPSDVANAILFLADDRSAFVTGQILNASGGWQI